jgi:hypothetical protein
MVMSTNKAAGRRLRDRQLAPASIFMTLLLRKYYAGLRLCASPS